MVWGPNSVLPVIIWYAITARANWSARPSTASPRICSGAMYSTVPITMPVGVTVRVSLIRAMPKSMILAVPAASIMTLAGLISRWITPREWV